MKVVVSGGSGFIGKQIVSELLRAGHRVTVLSRDPSRARAAGDPRATFALFSPSQTFEVGTFDGCDAVINLAGEGVADARWTDARKAILRSSRIATTTALARAVAALAEKPKVFVSASAIGIYGFREDGSTSDESDHHGSDFLATLCEEWEAAAEPARAAGIRVAHPRIGIVLGTGGGALKEMLPPFRAFAGGPLGSGEQFMSFVHEHDAVRAILFPLETEALAGPYNVTAPSPVTMDTFARTLGKVLGRPSVARVPAFVLRTILGEERANIVLAGHRVVPARLESLGFRFEHPALEGALRDLLRAG
ncbi:MAG: TIGR01777 family oxidoreductase [Polyangiaceae bacterium]